MEVETSHFSAFFSDRAGVVMAYILIFAGALRRAFDAREERFERQPEELNSNSTPNRPFFSLLRSYLPNSLGSLEREQTVPALLTNIETSIIDAPDNTEIQYIDARAPSILLRYCVVLTAFILVPSGLFAMALKMLFPPGFKMTWETNATLLVLFFIMLLLIAAWTFLQKFWILKIILTTKGLSVFYLFRKFYVPWDTILAMDIVEVKGPSFSSQEMVQVKTARGDFYFPLSMQESTSPIMLDTFCSQWVNAKGEKKSLSPENCPLFTEIKKRLGNR